MDVGDLTEPGNHGEPLFVVARDDIVRITVSVPEMYATQVEPGDRVLVRLQALSGRNFEAKVTRTSWMLDAKNRTLRTEIDVPNPKGILRPGLYAHATIVVEEHKDVLSVPTSALVRQDSITFCIAVAGGEICTKTCDGGSGRWHSGRDRLWLERRRTNRQGIRLVPARRPARGDRGAPREVSSSSTLRVLSWA